MMKTSIKNGKKCAYVCVCLCVCVCVCVCEREREKSSVPEAKSTFQALPFCLSEQTVCPLAEQVQAKFLSFN